MEMDSFTLEKAGEFFLLMLKTRIFNRNSLRVQTIYLRT